MNKFIFTTIIVTKDTLEEARENWLNTILSYNWHPMEELRSKNKEDFIAFLERMHFKCKFCDNSLLFDFIINLGRHPPPAHILDTVHDNSGVFCNEICLNLYILRNN